MESFIVKDFLGLTASLNYDGAPLSRRQREYSSEYQGEYQGENQGDTKANTGLASDTRKVPCSGTTRTFVAT